MRRVTKEYVAAVMKAREERNTAHTVEGEARKQALKDDDHGDPVVRLLHVTQTAAHAQCEKAVDAFLSPIKKTLQKHVPVHAQGPLISNALSTAFQFQMSVCHMIGKECIRPMRAKHSDWCGMAGIVQAIVEMFPKNCALMFPRCPHLHWLRSLLPSGIRRLRTMMTMTTTTAPAPAFAGLIAACRHPRVGTLAKQVTPTCPLPYFTGVPSVYQPTQRSHPVALSVQLQTTTRNVAHSWVTTIWTWSRRPTMREMARRIRPATRPYLTPTELEILQEIIKPAAPQPAAFCT